MVKTISLSDETHKEFMKLKLDSNARSTDKLLKELLVEHKKKKFLAASKIFRQKMDEKGFTLRDVSKSSKKVRKELYDEWFG